MLPGLMMPPGLMGGGKSIAYRSASTSTGSATVSYPAGISAGDLLVLFDIGFGENNAPVTVTPSGFTVVSNVTGSNARAILSYKIATGSESGSLTGMDLFGAEGGTKILAAFDLRGAGLDEVGTFVGSITSGNHSPQVSTAAGSPSPVLVIAAYSASGAVDPRSMSPAKDGEIGPVTSYQTQSWLAWKIFNDTPENVTADMDDEGNRNTLISGYFLFS